MTLRTTKLIGLYVGLFCIVTLLSEGIASAKEKPDLDTTTRWLNKVFAGSLHEPRKNGVDAWHRVRFDKCWMGHSIRIVGPQDYRLWGKRSKRNYFWYNDWVIAVDGKKASRLSGVTFTADAGDYFAEVLLRKDEYTWRSGKKSRDSVRMTRRRIGKNVRRPKARPGSGLRRNQPARVSVPTKLVPHIARHRIENALSRWAELCIPKSDDPF